MTIRFWILKQLSLAAFNFGCTCGANIVAPVPKKKGDVVEVECACHSKYILTWHGDRFTFQQVQVERPQPARDNLEELSPAMQRLLSRDSESRN